MGVWIFLQCLIIVDIILVTIEIFFKLPLNIKFHIQNFDFCICMVLIIQWLYTFKISQKKIFLKQKSNWIDLIASIPFDALLPIMIPQLNLLRYLRLLRFIRIITLFNRFYNGIKRFVKSSNLDKIFFGVLLI